MSRCGCEGACLCFLEGGEGVTITGAGSELSPYIIAASAQPDSAVPGYYPDAPPTLANANDDEFDNGVLGGAWTEWDHGSLITVIEGDHGLKIESGATASVAYGGVYRAVPAGDWSLTTKCAMYGVGSVSSLSAGIAVLEDGALSSADFTVLEAISTATVRDLRTARWTQAVGGGATVIETLSVCHWGPYLRVARSGSTYTWSYSRGGVGWIVLSAATVPHAVAHVALVARASSSTVGGAYFDFWRQTDSGAVDQPLLGQVVTA